MGDDLADASQTGAWLDAFPWLEAVHHGDSAAGTAWWRQPIEAPGTPERRVHLARISELALDRLVRWTIGQIFPNLPSDTVLDALPLATRARNAVGRAGYKIAGDLQDAELTDLLDWPHVGVGTVDSMLQSLADAATGATAPVLRPPRIERSGAGAYEPDRRGGPVAESWDAPIATDLRLIAAWNVAIGQPTQSLLAGPLSPGTPSEIIKARQRLDRIYAGDVLDQAASELDAAELLARSINVFDDRVQDILARRFFADHPETLDELARTMGITRERVRQIEAKARASMAASLETNATLQMISATARELIGSVLPLDCLIEHLPALAHQVESVRRPAWRVLDRLDDAYEIKDGWCAGPTVLGAQSATQTRLLELSNAHGVVRLADFGELNPVIPPESNLSTLVAWLRYCGYVAEGDYVLTRTRSVGDRAAAALSLVGSPMSTQELLDQLGVERSVGSLKNAMSSDERFERVDRDRWALAEWGMAAYTGLRALIRDEVARGGGQVPMDKLIERITGSYTVTANSVIAYASSPPFEARGGVVRHAASDQTARKTPGRTRRLYRSQDAWLYRIRISKEHMRGSGSLAPIAIATILDLKYGQTRFLESSLGPQAIAWTGTQPSFGTIRRFLVAEDVEIDREMFLVIRDNGTFAAELVPTLTGNALEDALTLAGVPTGEARTTPQSALARAILLPPDSPSTSIIGGYRDRGDADIADLLPLARTDLDKTVSATHTVPSAEIQEILDLL